jgi:hypothetical protein
MWLHAGAASRDGGAVLLCGASGRGKSALITELCGRGWSYLADELAALDLHSDRVAPFPQAPTPRDETLAELPEDELDRLAKTEIALDPAVVCREASPVVAAIFPGYSRGASTSLRRCTRIEAAAELLQSCVNFNHHGACAVRYACRLVERVPAFRLTYGSRMLATDSIHRLSEEGWELHA